jgi:hypothetical protein
VTVEIYEGDAFKEMEKVAKEVMKGYTEHTVARRLGMKVAEVRGYWNQYRDLLHNSSLAVDAARDHLNVMVEQYNDLTSKLYENLEHLDELAFDKDTSAQINTTTKNIGDLLAKRVDLLQKAGILEGADMGAELAEMERKQDILIDILRNDLCEQCQPVVARRLREVTGQVEVVRNESGD